MVQLTRKRRDWATARKEAPTFKGTKLAVPAGVQARYAAQLDRLTRQMTEECTRRIKRLFESETGSAHFAQDATISSQSRILLNALRGKFETLFAQHARSMAEQMVNGAGAASKSAMHSSLQALSGGMSLKVPPLRAGSNLDNIYKASVTENVNLIKSIPSQYLKDVEGSTMRSITTGNGLQDLVPALEKYEGQTHRRAKNIAMDQTRKAYNSINKGRMQAVGVKKFQWNHSGGSDQPREDHIEMDGNVYSFDDLPVIDERSGERGIPGQAINCRCTMTPVFDFEGDES